jgi:hypothetical protein
MDILLSKAGYLNSMFSQGNQTSSSANTSLDHAAGNELCNSVWGRNHQYLRHQPMFSAAQNGGG